MSFGSDSGTKTQQVVTNNTPWQSSALQKGIDSAQTVLDTPQSYYPDQTFAGFDNLQTQAQNGIVNQAMQGAPGVAAATAANNATLNGTYLNGGNPAYSAMVDRATKPLIDNFQNNIVPTINSGFSDAGRLASGIARQGQLDRQANNLASNIGDISANLAYQNYGAERQNMMNAEQLAPGLDQAAYMPYQQLDQVGAARQGMAQNGITDAINRFNFGQNEEANRIGRYMGLVGGGYGGTATSVQPVQSGNGLLQGAGLASLGVGMANTLFNPSQGLFPGSLSDRRLKRDIKLMGTRPDGLGVYSFRYVFSDIPQVGFMADEVKLTHPHAVSTRLGVDYVDYDMVA